MDLPTLFVHVRGSRPLPSQPCMKPRREAFPWDQHWEMVVLVWAGLRAIAGCWAQACIVLLASLGTEVVAPTLVSGLLGSCSHPGRLLFLCLKQMGWYCGVGRDNQVGTRSRPCCPTACLIPG